MVFCLPRFKLLLPLKTTFRQEVSSREFNNARKALLRASPYSVFFHSNPAVIRQDSESLLMSCFSNTSRSSSSTDTERCCDKRTSSEKPYCRHGRVLIQKQYSQPQPDDSSSLSSLNLLLEVHSLNFILVSRTVVPFQDIVEIRTGTDAFYFRQIRTAKASKAVTLFANQMCFAFEFDSACHQNEFVKYCRQMSMYCRGSE